MKALRRWWRLRKRGYKVSPGDTLNLWLGVKPEGEFKIVRLPE